MKNIIKIIFLSSLYFSVSLLAACETTKTSTVFTSKKESKDQRVDTLLQIGLSYIEAGEVELAMQSLEDASKMAPKNPQVHETLALAFQQTGEYTLAQHHFELMLKYAPEYTRGRNNYAVFLYSRGAYKASCDQMLVVVKDVYYSRRSDAFANLGLCAKKLGNATLARTNYRRALMLNPRQAQSYLELAELDFQANDFTAAQTNLKNFHELIPKGVARSLLLGYRIAKLFNQKVEAETYKRALLRLYPSSTEAGLL